MKVITIVLFQRTKYFMRNILCTNLRGQTVRGMECRHSSWRAVVFHAVLQKSKKVTCCYIELYVTYWLILGKLCLTC